ncbi:hypothetical protein MASR2M48_32570 [Spirochaetota bacterium]
MTIAMLDEGSEFLVDHVCLCKETGRRLADMGFTQGAHGRIIRRSFFGGPVQIRLESSDLMLRASEAAGVDVEAVGGCPLRGRGRGRGGQGGRVGRWGRGGRGRPADI